MFPRGRPRASCATHSVSEGRRLPPVGWSGCPPHALLGCVLNGDFFHIWTETSYPLERRRSWILNYLRCLLALFKTKPNQTSVYAPLANPVFTDLWGVLIMEIRNHRNRRDPSVGPHFNNVEQSERGMEHAGDFPWVSRRASSQTWARGLPLLL